MLKTIYSRFAFSTLKVPFPNVNHKPAPYTGPSFEQVVKDRKDYYPSFYFHYYQKPLLITEGYLQYLYDHEGKRYIDLIGGISTISVGHSHPAITKVASEQIGKLQHISQIYFNEWQGEYAKKLSQELGGDYSIYLCNSGGEANDFAVFVSRLFTGQYKIFTLKNAYHGSVGNSANLTNVGTWNSGMRGGFEFDRLSWPHTKRGALPSVELMTKDAEQALNASAANGKIAGFIFEPIQGVGGLSPPPQEFIKNTVDLVRNKYGGLIIADEVQTGFGRVGTKYWGHKWQGIKPDIVTMAKGIGNGLPIGAVAARKDILDSIKNIYFNTFGGGILQCRVGCEVLDTIRKQKLAENSENVGNYFLTELARLQKSSRNLGNVTGTGLMIGIDIVKNKETNQAGKDEANKLMELSREKGVLFGKGGVFGNILRIQPPMCLNMDDAKYVIAVLEDSLNQL